MEEAIVRRLQSIGVWIPGSKEHIGAAFEFWAPLFNWRNPANCPKVKQRRLAAVEAVCSSIYIMPHGVLGFRSIYYKENTELCRLFWQRASTFANKNGYVFEVREWTRMGARYPIKGYDWILRSEAYKKKTIAI